VTVPLIAGAALTLWLLWEAWWDYHDQNLPLWFSLVPLAAGLIYRAALGDWPAALFAALLVASTELPSALWRVPALGILAALAATNLPPVWLPLIAGCVLAELLFELGAMGGADALAIIYTMLWFPLWTALGALLAGMLVLSLVQLLVR
jgi:Flp pilus assembly protein protease CpaA